MVCLTPLILNNYYIIIYFILAMMKLKERGMKIRMEKYGVDKEPDLTPELKSNFF